MNEQLLLKIDHLIDNCTEKLSADIKRLINIKSEQSAPLPNAPFGSGPKAVADTFLDMATAAGLHCTDYKVGVVCAAMKKEEADLGIWLHGDVVDAGDGWNFPPYDATEYKGCIIGRGATDNKGQLAAILHLFKIFKSLGIELGYNPAIYLGSNEETGMQDLTAFLKENKPPRLSLVPDSSFPIGYGGKGSVKLRLKAKRPLQSCTFTAGLPNAPGKAEAMIDGQLLSEFSPPRHGASPDPSGNMITFLTEKMLQDDRVAAKDKPILLFLNEISKDIYGKTFHIDTEHDILGKLTVFSKQVSCTEGYCSLWLDIRYPLGITYEQIIEQVEQYANGYDFCVQESTCNTLPYLLDKNSEIVRGLSAVVAQVTESEKQPYTLSGGTYAHRLPNAYPFGMEGCLPPDDFPKGRGGAHGLDEAVSLARLRRGMKIYARALLYLNETTW